MLRAAFMRDFKLCVRLKNAESRPLLLYRVNGSMLHMKQFGTLPYRNKKYFFLNNDKVITVACNSGDGSGRGVQSLLMRSVHQYSTGPRQIAVSHLPRFPLCSSPNRGGSYGKIKELVKMGTKK